MPEIYVTGRGEKKSKVREDAGGKRSEEKKEESTREWEKT